MEMLRETFFMKGFITAMVIAVLTKVIVWANYHRLLVSSEEMERPKRYWIGTLKKKIENYYNLQTKVNNISCIVDKYFEADKILGINSFFLEQIPGFCAIICVGLGCLGAIRGIAMNADINFWGRNLIIGVVCGISIFMMDYLTKMDQMKRKIKINLINYLENILPNHMLKDTVICIDSDLNRTRKVYQALEEICYEFDLSKPLWLDHNKNDFIHHSKTRFNSDSFVEDIDFDFLEIQVIEED